jgi:tRNA_anti-like
LSKRNVFFFLLLVAFGVGAYLYKEYNRKPASLDSLPAVVNINADTLINQFTSNEAEANKNYLGKVISVKGFINKVENQQDTLLTIVLGDTLLPSGVSCLMDTGYIKLKKVFTPGAQITIKGICTGYLMDVELNRCVVE